MLAGFGQIHRAAPLLYFSKNKVSYRQSEYYENLCLGGFYGILVDIQVVKGGLAEAVVSVLLELEVMILFFRP